MNTLQSISDHVQLIADVGSRVNSIVAITGMSHDEVYHGVYKLWGEWQAQGGDIMGLLEWIYQRVSQGEPMKELTG